MFQFYFLKPIKTISLTILAIAGLNLENVLAQIINSDSQLHKASGHSDGGKRNFNNNGMKFTQNEGQFVDMNKKLRPDILFKGEGSREEVYIRNTGISYVSSNMSQVTHEINEQFEEKEKNGTIYGADLEMLKRKEMENAVVKIQRVDIDFVNAKTNTEIQTDGQLDGYTNYFLAHCPNGITSVKSFNNIIQKNVYNNIDVKYYGGKEKGLKYDIVVNPGGDPKQIKLKYSGATELKITNACLPASQQGESDGQGELRIKNAFGEMIEYMPKVYQNINGKIVDVKAEYSLESIVHSKKTGNSFPLITHDLGLTTQDYIVSFTLGNYQTDFPLIIDPYLWATYYGGLYQDFSGGINTDPAGNVLVSGTTLSLDFPVSAGATQLTLKGGNYFYADAFVIKFDANGGRLWATYYGGTNSDYAYGIDADAAGNIVVTGNTWSTNFPVLAIAGGYNQLVNGGGGQSDAFIVKFSPAGAPLWATYYGGSSFDNGRGLTIDGGSNIAFTGLTYSANFPIGKIGANISFQGANGGNQDVYVVKLNSNGARQWSTYYGGTSNENSGGITSDPAGNLSITGDTQSANFSTGSVGPYISTQLGTAGFIDAFVVKFDPTGARLFSTFYGGAGLDSGRGIASDASGNIVITGYTNNTFPTTPFAFQTVLPAGGGSGSSFVIKLSSLGNLLWSTYHGGTTDCWSFACCIDQNDYIYVFGDFEDNDDGNFPMTATCALQSTPPGGSEDCFITKFRADGKRICSTFIGGIGEDELDYGGGITAYGNYIYIALTDGTDPQINNWGPYPVTPGAFQTTYGGGVSDAIIAKICGNSCGDANSLNVNFNNAPVNLCNNAPIQFSPLVSPTLTCDTNYYTYSWTFAGALTANSNLESPGGIIYSIPGTYTVTLNVNGVCASGSISKTITITNCSCTLGTPTIAPTNVTCNGSNNGSAQVAVNGGTTPYTYQWSNAQTGATTTGLVAGIYSVTVTDSQGCTSVSSVTVIAPPALVAMYIKGAANCIGCLPAGTGGCKEWIMITAKNGTSPYTYLWPSGYDKRYQNKLCGGNYSIKITDKNGCSVNLIINAP